MNYKVVSKLIILAFFVFVLTSCSTNSKNDTPANVTPTEFADLIEDADKPAESGTKPTNSTAAGASGSQSVTNPNGSSSQNQPVVSSSPNNPDVIDNQPNTTPQPTSTPSQNVSIFEIGVDSIEINPMQTLIFPIMMDATIRGNFADGCTSFSRIDQTLVGNTIYVKVYAQRPIDRMCTEALVPFEKTFSLNIYGLKKGDYTVSAGDKSTKFTLHSDN